MALIMRNPLQNLAYRLTMSSDNRHKPPYIPTTTDILGLYGECRRGHSNYVQTTV